MALYLTSDLHFSGADDPLAHRMTRWLDTLTQTDRVIFAGDVFDLFVGGRAIFANEHKGVLASLQAAGARGVEVHVLDGNHDFFNERVFSGLQGVTYHSDRPIVLQEGGHRVWAEHGDLADPSDRGYRVLRWCLRSPLMEAFCRYAPEYWVRWVGRRMGGRGLPRAWARRLSERARARYVEHAQGILSQGHDLVVFGHCHEVHTHSVQIDGRVRQYFNIGTPREHGSIAKWDSESGVLTWIPLP